MSVLINDQCVIHHIPKCGGMSVRVLLKYNKIEHEIVPGQPAGSMPCINAIVAPFEKHHRPVASGKRSLMFVRDYVDWYRSYYGFRTEARKPLWGWKDTRQFDLLCRADTFSQFLCNVKAHYPDGFIRHLYAEYARYSTDIYRVESLFPALREFLCDCIEVRIRDNSYIANATAELADVTDADRALVRELEGSERYEI